MKDESYPIHYILNDKRSIFYEIDPDLQTGVLQMASRELPPDSSYTELFRILGQEASQKDCSTSALLFRAMLDYLLDLYQQNKTDQK